MGRRYIYEDVLVRGTNYRGSDPENCITLITDQSRKTKATAKLVPEPSNKTDKHAMAVYVDVIEKTGFVKTVNHTFHIGYLPKRMAYAVSMREQKGEFVDVELIEASKDEDSEYPHTFIVDVYVD